MMSDETVKGAIHEVLSSLDEDTSAVGLAERAHYSTAQYYRLVKKSASRPPMTVRRRLLLERAAYELTRTSKSVTETALDAGFETLEGFSRAFKRHFGVMPRSFRRLNPTEYWIDATAAIHYAPPLTPVGPARQGEMTLRIFERMISHHCWSTHRMLDASRALNDEQMDQEISTPSPFPWESECKESVRRLLQANTGFAEPWLESINGEKLESDLSTIDGLHARLDRNCDRFQRLVDSIEAEGRWDMTFVDALCDPPEVFSYVGVIGHVITFNAHRRIVLINELKKLGIEGLGFGDPIEYDPARRATA